MEKPILQLEALSKFYTSTQNVVVGLNRVSISFSRGEFVAITGESGSGKSTLAHILGGMLAVTAADTDEGLRMELPAAADDGTVLLVGHGGDGAGVDDVGVALFVEGTDLMAPLVEQLLHGLGLILVGFATKGVKSKFHCEFHQFNF